MKKLSLLSTREEMGNVMRELIHLGCVDVSEPDELAYGPELQDFLKLEEFMLDELSANRERLVLIGTQYTLLLTGWLTQRSAQILISRLPHYFCAWALEDPSPDEREIIPVELCCPGFFGKLRLAGRKRFAPLKSRG